MSAGQWFAVTALMTAFQAAVLWGLLELAQGTPFSTWLVAAASVAITGALGFFSYAQFRAMTRERQLADDRLLQALASGGRVAWDWDLASGRDRWLGDLKTMFGVDSQHFSGRVEDFHRRLHPADRMKVATAVAESRANRTPYHSTFRVIRPDGMTRWVDANGAFYYDEDGKPTRMVGIATDVTEQTRNEQALRESEQHFRQIADTAPAFLWLTGADGRCTYVNRFWTAFTGRRLDEELGSGWMEGMHPQDRRRNVELYLEAVATQEPFLIEYRLRRHDGVYRWVLDAGVPRFTADGVFAGHIGSAIDITELKTTRHALSNLSQRLMEAQEAERERMAKELDDEVVQRVVLLTIELDGLFHGLPREAGNVRAGVDDVRGRAGDLVRHLQSLSRRLHSTKLELLGLPATVGSYCRELAEQQHVTIDVVDTTTPGALPQEVSLQLFRVLQEALTNAVMHSGTRHFVVRLRGLADVVELEVSDEGCGFDPATALSGRGTGLVGMHERLDVVGGHLFVESRAGGGTRVRARVPRVAVANVEHGELDASPGLVLWPESRE